jgi:hypothetical protein
MFAVLHYRGLLVIAELESKPEEKEPLGRHR